MPTARERQENLRRRARTGQSSDEIEENKISDDYETALKQLAKIGYAPAQTQKKEPEALEVMEDTDGGLMTFGKSVARGAVGIPAGTLEFLGIGSAWLKGKVGLSDDVEDNTFYDWGKSLKKEGVLGVGAEGYIPNRFRGGTAGFVAVDAPQGVGSALGFIGEAAATGGIATAVKTGLKKGTKKLAVKKDMLPEAVREASDEADALAINLALKSGGDDVTREALEKEGKRLSPVAAKNKEAAEEKIRARMQAEADEKFKKNAARYSIVGIGGAVQASEGYHDAYNTLLSEARAEGRNYLTREEVDMAFNAAFANFPAGMVEVFGVELPVLRAIYGAKKGVADAATKKLIQDKGSESFLRKMGAVTKTRQIFDNLDFSTGGRFSRGLSRFAPLAGGASREALEEATQSFWMNMVASEIIGYDENRQLFDGVAKDSGVGGVAGFILGAANLVMGRKRAKLMDIERAVQQAERAEKAGNTEAAEEFRRQANELTEAFNQTEAVNESAVDDEHSEMQAAQEAEMNAEGEVATEKDAAEGALDLEGKQDKPFSTYGAEMHPISEWTTIDPAKGASDARYFRKLNKTYDKDFAEGTAGNPIYVGSSSLPSEQRVGEQIAPKAGGKASRWAKYFTGKTVPIGIEKGFATAEQAKIAEKDLVNQSSAYVADPSMMKGEEGATGKPLTKAQKAELDKQEAKARGRLDNSLKPQSFGTSKAGYFVIDETGKVLDEKFASRRQAAERRDEIADLSSKTAAAVKGAKKGKSEFAVRKLKNGKYVVANKDGKTAVVDENPTTIGLKREALGIPKPRRGKATPKKVAKKDDKKAPTETPSEKPAQPSKPTGDRILSNELFNSYANKELQKRGKDRGLTAEELVSEQKKIATWARDEGPDKIFDSRDKVTKAGVELYYKEQTPAEAPTSTAAAAETASDLAPAIKEEQEKLRQKLVKRGVIADTEAAPTQLTAPVSTAQAELIRQLKASSENQTDESDAGTEQAGAALLDLPTLEATEKLGRELAGRLKSSDFMTWAVGMMEAVNGDPDLIKYLKPAYNRLRGTVTQELTPQEDVDGQLGTTVIQSLFTASAGIGSKKKLTEPQNAKEKLESFFAQRNAKLLGIATSGVNSFNQILRKLGLDRTFLFFNRDGGSILEKGSGEPANYIEYTPEDRAKFEENLKKLERLRVLSGVFENGKKRLRSVKAQIQRLEKAGNIVYNPAEEEFTYPANPGAQSGSPKPLTAGIMFPAKRFGGGIPFETYVSPASSVSAAPTSEKERYSQRILGGPAESLYESDEDVAVNDLKIADPEAELAARAQFDLTWEEGDIFKGGLTDVASELKNLNDNLATLEEVQLQYEAELKKDFPAYLTSKESATKLFESLTRNVSEAGASPYYWGENIEQHEGVYNTLAQARKAARALQKKETNRAVGFLRQPDGTYAIYSEYLGPTQVSADQKVVLKSGVVMRLQDQNPEQTYEEWWQEQLKITEEDNVSTEERMLAIELDSEGTGLAQNEGLGDPNNFATILASKVKPKLMPKGASDPVYIDGQRYVRGLIGEVHRLVAEATSSSGMYAGVPVSAIKFAKSRTRKGKGVRVTTIGAPMFTIPADGHNTIYVDPTSLVHALETTSLEEIVGHELAHVVANRAVRSAVVHDMMNRAELLSDEQVSKRVSDTFANIWKHHKKMAAKLAAEVDHLPAGNEARKDKRSLLEFMSASDAEYNNVRSENAMRLDYEKDSNGVTRPVIKGGSNQTAYVAGAEWVRTLVSREVRDSRTGNSSYLPYSLGDVASKHTSGKVFSWISMLTNADLGVQGQQEVPLALTNMIMAARAIGTGSNAFVQKAAELNQVEVGEVDQKLGRKPTALDLAFDKAQKFILNEMAKQYSSRAARDKTESTRSATNIQGQPISPYSAEPAYFSMHIPYFEESIIKEAHWLHSLLRDIDYQIYAPIESHDNNFIVKSSKRIGKLITGKATVEYARFSTTFENEFAAQGRAWVYTTKAEDTSLKGLAKKWNTTEEAIAGNNPRLVEYLKENAGIVSTGMRVLMHPQAKGAKGGGSANALFGKAWKNAKANKAPQKPRRDAKADKLMFAASEKLSELIAQGAPMEQINQQRNVLRDARLEADIASEALSDASRSSVNDLQGRTDKLISLNQAQVLGEIPSTVSLIQAQIENGELHEYDANIVSDTGPLVSQEPKQAVQDIKAWGQHADQQSNMMMMFREKGALSLIEDSGMLISSRDLVKLMEILMEPTELDGQLATSQITKKKTTEKVQTGLDRDGNPIYETRQTATTSGLDYFARKIQQFHNGNASRLKTKKDRLASLNRDLEAATDPISKQELQENIAKVEEQIEKDRIKNFDGGQSETSWARGAGFASVIGESAPKKRHEGVITVDADQVRMMLDIIAQTMVDGITSVSGVSSRIYGEWAGAKTTGPFRSQELARKELFKEGEGVVKGTFADMVKQELQSQETWNTQYAPVMTGVDPVTEKPIYEYKSEAPWKSDKKWVIREPVTAKERRLVESGEVDPNTGQPIFVERVGEEVEVVVPALIGSTKEQWDEYIENGGRDPWQYHVEGYTNTLNYMPDSHKMFLISKALKTWRASQEQYGAAVRPNLDQVHDSSEKFWQALTAIRDSKAVDTKRVKSQSKISDNDRVDAGRKGDDSVAATTAFANWILTGNPAVSFDIELDSDPTPIFDRLERIISLAEGNPQRWHPNDFQNLMAGIKYAGSRLEVKYNIKGDEEGQLDEQQQMRLDQLLVTAHEAAINETAQIASSLALSRARNQLLGTADDLINWKATIRKLQAKAFGKVVGTEFVDKVKGLITMASDTASKEAVTAEVVEAVSRLAEGDARVGLEGALSELQKKDGKTTYQVSKPALYDALKRKFGESLNDSDLRRVQDLLWDRWVKARSRNFKKRLSESGLADGKILSVFNLADSSDNILRARDIGRLNSNITVSAGNLSVPLMVVEMWDTLAPAANLPYTKDKTSQRIAAIQERIQSQELEGVEAATLRYKVLSEVVERADLKWLSSEIVRDAWYAGALSGLRTYVDIGVGGTVHGFVATSSAALELLTTRRGVNPNEDATNILMSYIRTWVSDGIPIFLDILRTGDLSKLPDANERLMRQMTQEDFYGGESLEAMERKMKAEGKPWWHPKRIATLGRFSRRFVLGLDYVGAQAGRRAMMVYGASTRLYEAKKEGDSKDLTVLKAQYAQAQSFADKEIRNNALIAARQSLEAAFAKDSDIKITKAMVIAKAREIMESDITDDLNQSSTELGRVFALNNDPIGIGSQIHKAAQSLGVLKYGTGLAFSRAALNMVATASNYVPGLGYVNAFRSSKMADKIFEQYGWNDSKWGKLLNLRAGQDGISDERAKIIQLQAVTGTVLMALLWSILDDEDWEIHGSMDNLSSAKRGQLRSQGAMPYSIRYKDGAYLSLKATPWAMLIGAFGNIQDGKRYNGDDEKTVSQKLMAMNLGGFAFAVDAGPVSYATQLLQLVKRSDESSRSQMMGAFVQGWVGPIVSPNLLREVDAWLDDRHFKPMRDQHLEKFWQNLVVIPGVSFPRSAGMKPMLNALGEPVSVSRAPWARWIDTQPDDDVWQAVAQKSTEGVYLPGPSRNVKFVTRGKGGLERRDMTPSEEYEYNRMVGTSIRYELEKNLDWFRNATPDQASSWLDKKANAIRRQVRKQMGRTAE